MTNNMHPTKEQIAKRAYLLYLKRGREHGWDLEDWLMAENQLLTELNETPEERLVRVAIAAAHSLGGNPRVIRTHVHRRR